ncbi:hypothetical protein DPEC_G00091080 [Dallia pectoralis]|uniref:Uncharacterized protein n=1 Tax=Dallia pectoralis TaxID=75939 RepID=A0ACC2H144_DALPE|nr:hypothetical protein DPEC_G00091080 [Dallia pectoralis]
MITLLTQRWSEDGTTEGHRFSAGVAFLILSILSSYVPLPYLALHPGTGAPQCRGPQCTGAPLSRMRVLGNNRGATEHDEPLSPPERLLPLRFTALPQAFIQICS